MPKRLATVALAILAAVLCGDGGHLAAEEAEALRFPVRAEDMPGVMACFQGQSAFCKQCDVANPDNVSLTNYAILRHALWAGGIYIPLVPVLSPNSERSRRMVEDGSASIKSDWAFNVDGNDALIKSTAFIGRGEIQKGVFGVAGNPRLSASGLATRLGDLFAVTNRNWRLDWWTLDHMHLGGLQSAPTTSQIFHLIHQNRADFTLMEFSSAPDMGREVDGMRLVPVPGVKVSLPASQHFMISKSVPDAEYLRDRLDQGIGQLRENGFIHRCLAQSGIINDRVADWQVLNTDQLDEMNDPFY